MFETFSAIILLIFFLVPGYIWRTMEGQFIYLNHRLPWEKFALGLLTRSTLIYLPFLPWIYQGYQDQWYDKYLWCVTGAAVAFIAILPILIGTVIGIARQKDWLGCFLQWKPVDVILNLSKLKTFDHHRRPTAWDAVFNSNLKQAWVIVTRKSGDKIHGLLAPGSHMSVDAEDRDLFVSKTLYADESGNYKFVPHTRGVYIKADEISTIELIDCELPEQFNHE